MRNEAAPPPTIIDVGPDRFAECLEVLHEGFGTEVADYGITAENAPSNPAFWDATWIPALVDRGFQLFAIEDGGRIAGCAFVGPSRRRPETWILRHLATRPSVRHRGHGESLVLEAARRARAGGAGVVRIGIVAENHRLSEWYQRLGFVTTETAVRHPGLVFTVDHLELRLRAVPLPEPSNAAERTPLAGRVEASCSDLSIKR